MPNLIETIYRRDSQFIIIVFLNGAHFAIANKELHVSIAFGDYTYIYVYSQIPDNLDYNLVYA